MTSYVGRELPEELPVVAAGAREDLRERIRDDDRWQRALRESGAVLFRGFGIDDVESFEQVIDAVVVPDTTAPEESSPRSSVGAAAFTSTEYPPEYPIQPHNEFSYRARWPGVLLFCCVDAPHEGGATPLSDCRRVLDELSPELVARFEREGVLYVRNFEGLGVPWQTAFGTNDRAEVERYCRENDVEPTWSSSGLRTEQRRAATVVHPWTGERSWFNHALIWNVRGVEPVAVREALLALPAASLPTNSYYGRGGEIEAEEIDELRDAYARSTYRFSWERGDLLVVDNVLSAHGREPFSGPRRVLVGMGDARRAERTTVELEAAGSAGERSV